MLKFIFVVALALTLQSFVKCEEVNQFIVGGNDAVDGQFPYFASLRYLADEVHGCGGSIVNTRWILTTASCLLTPPTHALVGSISVSSGGDRYDIIQAFVHPDFIPTLSLVGHNFSNHHDIAVVKVDREIIFNEFVSAIPLARRRVFQNSQATVVGFGLSFLSDTWQLAEELDTLQFMQTTVISNAECSIRAELVRPFQCRYTTPFIYPGHICTLSPHGIGTCIGDTGGPIVTNEGVAGVVVNGVRWCGRGSPDVYVRVSTYVEWIESHIQDLS